MLQKPRGGTISGESHRGELEVPYPDKAVVVAEQGYPILPEKTEVVLSTAATGAELAGPSRKIGSPDLAM